MNNIEFRKLLAKTLSSYNAYHGQFTGEFSEHGHKINYTFYSTLTEGTRTYFLTIFIHDKSSTHIDTLTDEIEQLFNYKSIEQNGSFATFYMEMRNNQDEKDIYVRTLTYEVHTQI